MHYDIHDWPLRGKPGEYLYGDEYYTPDEYIEERWKRDVDFPDYWVSTDGRVWSSISKSFIHGSPTGRCGHIDMSLRVNGRRVHKYLHHMVAEAFIPNPCGYPIVRHLDDDPENNCVDNLAWGTQIDNVRDCINNGNFRYLSFEDRELAMRKRRAPVKAIDIRSGREYYFDSQQEASRELAVHQSSIYKVLSGKNTNAGGYYFCDPNDDPIDISTYRHSRHFAKILATNIRTGEQFIFRGQTEAARELGMSIASVSNVLSGKQNSAKGYYFEYSDEVEYNDGY